MTTPPGPDPDGGHDWTFYVGVIAAVLFLAWALAYAVGWIR